MDIAGSTFVVTGGASGLGAATARHLVSQGGRVVIADLKEAEGAALAMELGADARFVRTDVTDEASGRAAVADGEDIAAFDPAGVVDGVGEIGGGMGEDPRGDTRRDDGGIRRGSEFDALTQDARVELGEISGL